MLQIWDRREWRLVYSSPAVAEEVLHGNPALRSEQLVHGQTYQVFRVDTPRWSVLWARTLIDTPWLLKRIGSEAITNVAIAIPCLLLPVWLAVLLGLRPLRQFAERIAARGANEMSPIGLAPKHSEMMPLARALEGLLEKLRQKITVQVAFWFAIAAGSGQAGAGDI